MVVYTVYQTTQLKKQLTQLKTTTAIPKETSPKLTVTLTPTNQTKDKPRNLNYPTGYVKNVYERNNKWYLDIDYIKLYFGDKDKEETVKDGVCDSINQCSWPNNFALRNLNKILTTHQNITKCKN